MDLFSGGLSFVQTDVSLPGNDHLQVSVGRNYKTGRREVNRHFGDWDLEIPHLTGYFPRFAGWVGTTTAANGGQTADALARCTKFGVPASLAPDVLMNYNRADYWQGNNLYVPGQGSQEILTRSHFVYGSGFVSGPNTAQPTDGNGYPLVTKGNWQIRCVGSLARGSGEGFLALSPSGTQYRFDWMVPRNLTPIKMGTKYGSLDEVWIMPTQVQDRFGNTVTYTYDASDPWRLIKIAASDGRQLNIGYNGDGRISTVNDGTRTWTYGYAGDGSLSTVTRPDATSWTFSIRAFAGAGIFRPAPECGMASIPPTNTRVGTMTHPSGAVGTFTTKYVMRNRRGFLMPCDSSSGDPNLPVVAYRELGWSPLALQTKALTGPGIATMQWSYAYGNNGDDDAVSVTAPEGNATRYTFGNYYNVDNGLLKRVDEGWNGTSALRTTVNTYASPQGRPYPEPIGYSDQPSDPIDTRHRPVLRREIGQQGSSFVWQANAFDALARASAVTRASSLGYSKSETTAYADNTGKWVLGQVASQTVAGITAASTSYDGTTALPTARYRFGKLQASYGYNPDGTLSTVTDGAGQATTYSNYKRGLARNIAYADGSGQSAAVNDIGLVTSLTDAAGFTTSYGYDAMGRLSAIAYPAGDTVAWNATSIAFEPVGYAEYELPAGHWRQTVATGNARAVTYFDALWRPRLSRTFDAANEGATAKTVLRRFDSDNRTVFESYPVRTIASVDAGVFGVSSSYDPLGRIAGSAADSELGSLSTNTQYLANFQKQVTNPRGHATTTAYQAFDEPSDSAIASIIAPEGVSVSINRDVFGKPLSITRSGPAVPSGPSGVTRSYVYDAYQRLCKTIEPEIGATVEDYDAADNLVWRASGLALPSTSSCDHASVSPASAVAYTYDARNRLTGTGFGDGSPGIGRAYTADGLPLTVVSNGSTWTYGYNRRRLLSSENLAFPGGGAWGVQRAYDANGSPGAITYPDGTSVALNPNALGEPTQVGSYASNVSHHPNGAVAGYTLANGIVHSLSQNTRGLPLVNRDAGVLQDQYAFDANGNVGSITDQQEGISNRSMGYDGLDRLTAANAPNVWGNASYGYDGLDNLRTSSVGGRSTVHGYDAANRLSSLSVNGTITGYAYDSRGNITGKGIQGYYFDMGNRLQLANGIASYAYDGLGRRVLAYGANGTNTYQLYSQDGQLLMRQPIGNGNNSYTLHLYLGGKAIAEHNSASGVTYLHTDALGSPVAKTNAAGALLSRTRYEAYGNTAAGTTPTAIGFTGHANDADTGLVYMQQRYYDPIAGRFLSVDPVTTDASNGALFNRYMYAANNPLTHIDPDGRCTGSNITNGDGTCKSTGGFTTGADSMAQGMQRDRALAAAAPAGAANAPGGPQIEPTWEEIGAVADEVATVASVTPLGMPLRAAKGATTVIGRVKDLRTLGAGEKSLLDRLPNLGGPKANWQQNVGVLREEIRLGKPIRDASPGDTAGQFLNAERNLLRDRGWTFDPKSNFWNPPVKP